VPEKCLLVSIYIGLGYKHTSSDDLASRMKVLKHVSCSLSIHTFMFHDTDVQPEAYYIHHTSDFRVCDADILLAYNIQ
jgi:hypothetical protein